MSRLKETQAAIGRGSATLFTDINGTFAGIGQPLSKETQDTIRRLQGLGNKFGPHTSHDLRRAQTNTFRIADIYGTELGGAAHDRDLNVITYHPLSSSEKETLCQVIVKYGSEWLSTAAFLPKVSHASENHGSLLYIAKHVPPEKARKFRDSRIQVDNFTDDPDVFARWINLYETALVELEPRDGNNRDLPEELDGLNRSYDTSGKAFVTHEGVNKAALIKELVQNGYLRLDPSLIFGGDSTKTDGPVIEMQDPITKIVVGEPEGRQLEKLSPTPETTIWVPDPEGARLVIENMVRKTS